MLDPTDAYVLKACAGTGYRSKAVHVHGNDRMTLIHGRAVERAVPVNVVSRDGRHVAGGRSHSEAACAVGISANSAKRLARVQLEKLDVAVELNSIEADGTCGWLRLRIARVPGDEGRASGERDHSQHLVGQIGAS